MFIDAGPHKGYAIVFEKMKNGDGLLLPDQLERAAAKLGVSADVLRFDGPITEDAFVAKCKEAIGEERSVVIKFMQDEQQWRRERTAREERALDPRFVVLALPAPSDDKFQRAVENLEGGLRKFVEQHLPKDITLGTRALVMDLSLIHI